MSDRYVNLSQASRLTGIPRPTLRRILARGSLEGFRNPADARVRLVKLEDLQSLMTPVPEHRPAETEDRRQGAAV